MYYYFSSEYAAALKVNGRFSCSLSTKPTLISNLEKNSFIEFCSLDDCFQNKSLILSDEFLSCPPDFFSVVDIKGGYLIHFSPPFFTNDYKLISQRKTQFSLCNLFLDGGAKVSLTTNNDFYSERLKFHLTDGQFFTLENSENFIALITKGTLKSLSVYDLRDKINKIYFVEGNEIDFNRNCITITQNKRDMFKHKITYKLSIIDGQIKTSDREIIALKNASPSLLTDRLIPYAFYEEMVLGGSISSYLSPDLCGKQSLLSDYLGEFIGVITPPPFRDYFEIGLIYKKTKNTYYVRYVLTDVLDKKITNVKLLDN